MSVGKQRNSGNARLTLFGAVRPVIAMVGRCRGLAEQKVMSVNIGRARRWTMATAIVGVSKPELCELSKFFRVLAEDSYLRCGANRVDRKVASSWES